MLTTSSFGFPWQHGIIAGNYWAATLDFENADGTAVDWTGATAALHVLDQFGDLVIEGSAVIGGTGNSEIACSLTEAQTALCKTGHVLVLAVEDSLGNHIELARGPVIDSKKGVQP